LTTTKKIGKKRWKRKRKGHGEKIKERQTGLDKNFVAQKFSALTQYVLESDFISL
jgi:hypothetical protein